MDSENKVARRSRASRIARGIGIITLVASAAVAIHFLAKNSPTTNKSRTRVGDNDELVKAPSEAVKDAAPQNVSLAPEMVRKYGIRIGTVQKRKLVSKIIAPARVAFNSEAMAVIGTPVQGRVAQVMVHAGDHVDAGAVLAEIESAELGEAQSDYLERHAALHTAQAAIQPLTEIYERVKKLFNENQLIGINQVQQHELELKRAVGTLTAAQASLVAAENKLHLFGMKDEAISSLLKSGRIAPRYALSTPLAGDVIERLVNLGELVKPEREKLFVVADTRTLWVWADVPENRASEVATGCPAEITFASAGESSFAGAISYISPRIDDPTRSLRVRIEVKGDPGIRPGMFVQAQINGKISGEAAEPVLSVPESAIQTVNGSTAVFLPVKDRSNAFQSRLVSTGNYVDGMVGIISGLDDGERVVTAGSAILKAELLKSTAKDED